MYVSALITGLTCCPPDHQLFSCFKSNFKINQFHLHYTCTESVTRNKSKGVSHGESIGTPRVSFIEFAHCTSNRQGKTHNYKCVRELHTTLCRGERTRYWFLPPPLVNFVFSFSQELQDDAPKWILARVPHCLEVIFQVKIVCYNYSFSLQQLFFLVEVSHLNLDYQYKFSALLGSPRSS